LKVVCTRENLLEIFPSFFFFQGGRYVEAAGDSADSVEETVITSFEVDSNCAAVKREATHFRRFKRNTRNQSL
jgi:hypothetical protein